MTDNKQIIERFYSAFQKLDYKTMNDCYSDDIIFSDPVFLTLKADEVKNMWEMLCKNAKDFSLTFSDIELIDEEYATCKWIAKYTFSKTGNKVTNNIKAFMRIKNGKIIEHSDAFRLSTWLGQALGWKGVWWLDRVYEKSSSKKCEKESSCFYGKEKSREYIK